MVTTRSGYISRSTGDLRVGWHPARVVLSKYVLRDWTRNEPGETSFSAASILVGAESFPIGNEMRGAGDALFLNKRTHDL